MTETNNCVEKDALIDYLYGEVDAHARTRVDAHLRICEQCADEIRELKEVRGTLDAWAPPEVELGFRVVSDADPMPAPVSLWGRLRRPRCEAFRQHALKLVPPDIAAADDDRHEFPGVVGGGFLKSRKGNAGRTFYSHPVFGQEQSNGSADLRFGHADPAVDNCAAQLESHSAGLNTPCGTVRQCGQAWHVKYVTGLDRGHHDSRILW